MADVGNFFKKTLPAMAAAVGSAIPGPIGAVAKIVGGLLNKPDLKADAGEIAAAVAGATPEQIIQLRIHDQDFQATMQKMGFDHIEDMEKVSADDRKDARAMQVQTRDWIAPTLAILITVGFFGLLTGMLTGKLHVSDQQALLLLLGALSTSFGAVVMFYFGSSAGSDRKTELLAQAPPIEKKP